MPNPNEARVVSSLPDVALTLLGHATCVLHPRAADPGDPHGGGDEDCAVQSLDLRWPLRLRAPARVIQCIRHGPTGWYWVIERNGQAAAVDVLDDPLGLGPYCFSTGLALEARETTLQAVRAAFLTAKRIRKGKRAAEYWEHISHLARTDQDAYRSALVSVFGKALGKRLAPEVLQGRVPDARLWRIASGALRVRRARSPRRIAILLGSSVARGVDRLLHPTGLIVEIVGPDGTGKSSLSESLLEELRLFFWKHARFHWRPGLLPRAGALVSSEAPDPGAPHARPPRGRLASLALLGYYWVDFFLGGWLRQSPLRIRSGLVIIERGWFDIMVDPRRYRMRPSPTPVQALARLLPRPDVTIALEAPPEILLARKQEIPAPELDRQMQRWREVLSARRDIVTIDAARPLPEVVAEVRDALLRRMEARTSSRTGPGWANLPPRGARWVLPRGPRRAAAASLHVYQPVTLRGLLGWGSARLATPLGILRLFPRGHPPPSAVRRALASHVPARGTIATLRANHPDRYLALIIDEAGHPAAVAKIALGDAEKASIAGEAEALRTSGPMLPPPLSAPRVLFHENGLLILEAVRWLPRLRPWLLDEEVARSLGAFFARTRKGNLGIAHGDFAPWNLLRSETDWVLVDWENSGLAPPFYDLFHHLVQTHVLLGRLSREHLLRGLTRGEGGIGWLIRVYAEAAGVGTDDITTHFRAYLAQSRAQLEPNQVDGRKALKIRDELLRAIEEPV